MSAAQAWIGYAGTAALAVLLAGVLVRRRYRAWYLFALFLSVMLLSTVMMAIWRARFYTTEFWQIKETALNFIRFAMALELAYRTFRAFPGALAALRWVLLFVVVVTLAAVLAVPGPSGGTLSEELRTKDYESFLGDLQPRVLNGSIWLFAAIAALILWYRLPANPFPKSVLLSYVPYLLVFSLTMNVVGVLGRARWEQGWPVRYLNQLAYLALMVHWARAAWRRVEQPARRPPARRPGLGAPVSA
jgi:hypothetical protein